MALKNKLRWAKPQGVKSICKDTTLPMVLLYPHFHEVKNVIYSPLCGRIRCFAPINSSGLSFRSNHSSVRFRMLMEELRSLVLYTTFLFCKLTHPCPLHASKFSYQIETSFYAISLVEFKRLFSTRLKLL